MHKVCAEKPKACFVMNRDRKQVIKHEEFFFTESLRNENYSYVCSLAPANDNTLAPLPVNINVFVH